jgi:cysteine desulfurase
MAANNETGVLQPVREIVERVRGRALKAVIHSDVVQLPGKAGCTFADLGVDIMTLSGHKFGALAGVGCVVAKGSLTLAPLIVGGPQEEKVRGGTENVLGIAMMGIAAEKIAVDADRIQRMQAARDTFESFVLQALPECEINGVTEERLPNTTSLFVPGIRADDLVVALDLSGVLISAGAACTSGKPEPSHVLLAMGQSKERVLSTVRVSMRGDYPEGTPERVAKMFVTVVERMRRGGNPARAA